MLFRYAEVITKKKKLKGFKVVISREEKIGLGRPAILK